MRTASSAARARSLRVRVLEKILWAGNPQRDDAELDRRLGALRPRTVSLLARLAARNRPLAPYPGWHPGIEETHPIPDDVRLRLAIWRYFNSRRLLLPTRLKWHFGLRVDAYLGNDLTRFLYAGGAFDPNEFAFLVEFLRPGMTFVDAGANDGLYSLFASRLVGTQGKVIAIEPSSRELARLTSNIRLNRLANVTIVPVAVSDHRGTVGLRVADFEHAGHNTLGDFSYPETSTEGIEDVAVEPLDDVIERLELEWIDVVKLDVEGAEHLALEGAERSLRVHRPIVLLELFDAALRKQGSTGEDVLSFLTNLGYESYVFDPDTGRPKKGRPAIEGSPNILAAHRERPFRLPVS